MTGSDSIEGMTEQAGATRTGEWAACTTCGVEYPKAFLDGQQNPYVLGQCWECISADDRAELAEWVNTHWAKP